MLDSQAFQPSSAPSLCSVICTTYNHSRYSAAAIESIANQCYRPIEIVVVDDGSTDGNCEVIETALTDSNTSYTIIRQNNTANVAQNANLAISRAVGDVIIFMSLDDLMLPYCIASKMAHLAADPTISVVANGTYAEIDCSGRTVSARKVLPIYGNKIRSAAELKELEYECLGTYFLQGTAIRRSLLDAIGGFDEDIPGDDLNLRTKTWNYLITNDSEKVHILDRPGFAYRIHQSSLHKDALRQALTVFSWLDRYFPSRPTPKLARLWVWRLLSQLEDQNEPDELCVVLSAHPKLRLEYQSYRRTWTRFRRQAKSNARKILVRMTKSFLKRRIS